MRKLLLQLDSSRFASVFDRVVAYDAGADEVMSYGGVAEADVRDLVHGALFTRGPKDLRNSAIFIGGSNMADGEKLLAAAQKAFFGPFRVSLMLDSNGSNTTAVAAVYKVVETLGDVKGKRAVVTAGTGPVGSRAAGLLVKLGADVVITSRSESDGKRARDQITSRFGGHVESRVMGNPSQAAAVIGDAAILLNAGPAGVQLVPHAAWAGRNDLKIVADLNAVPPLGIEGVEQGDNATRRNGTLTFGAIGVGGFKMKVHEACITRLFERNDLVLDAETIADVAQELIAARK